jgi:hypothetical protein
MTVALITATAALVSGLVTAAVTGWLAGRAKVAEELRELRLSFYPPVWKRTSILSRWPRTNATYADLERLHLDLRRWYFGLGGVVLSENARARYGELQELAGTHLERDEAEPAEELKEETYAALMTLGSAFRTALTEDLESRRQRSLWWTIHRGRLHGRQRRAAERLRRNAEAGAARRRTRYELIAADRQLEEPLPPAEPGS